jgi:hypothetical protein
MFIASRSVASLILSYRFIKTGNNLTILPQTSDNNDGDLIVVKVVSLDPNQRYLFSYCYKTKSLLYISLYKLCL